MASGRLSTLGLKLKRGPLPFTCHQQFGNWQHSRRYISTSHLRQFSAFPASHTMSRSPETASFRFNHTMMRVKDPKASLHFYRDVLGMELLTENKYSDFTLYFLAFNHEGRELTQDEKVNGRFSREGILELTHNHGTESDPNFKGYANGNSEPRGYGHIAITVGDVEQACARFERLGVPFQKKLTDGKMRNIAFILDPDGYWVEILPLVRE